jgi:hypothetical protein
LCCACLASQQYPNPGQQFLAIEGLDEIVVGTRIEANYAVVRGVARR